MWHFAQLHGSHRRTSCCRFRQLRYLLRSINRHRQYRGVGKAPDLLWVHRGDVWFCVCCWATGQFSSSVRKPLTNLLSKLGGAFTNDSHLTWRWCFYINLPLGGATAAGIIICLRLKAKKKKTVRQSWLRTFKNLDPIGTLVFVPAIVCLLLALQWGGVNYAWSDPRIIALFVVFGVVIICFVVLQYFLKEDATVPARIAAQRSIMFASFFALCASGSFFIIIIYIPMWVSWPIRT